MSDNTIFERMGGESKVKVIISVLFDEVLKDDELTPFFENINTCALQVHHLKLFKVLFGPEEEKPNKEEFLDYMIATHTRMFREQGLNETHFDKFVECFERSLRVCGLEEETVHECVAEWTVLRIVFEQCAVVAAKEKTYSIQQFQTLPTTTAASLAQDKPTILPNPAWIENPVWLTETIKKHSVQGVLRAWTCELVKRFGVQGDRVIADIFMDMPYMNHHVYASALLQLAFLPRGQDASDLLDVLRYPRGPKHSPLYMTVWERMIQEFGKTCDYFMMDSGIASRATRQLRSYHASFRKGNAKLVGGVTSDHVLRKVVLAEFDVSALHHHNGHHNKSHHYNHHSNPKSKHSSSPSSTNSVLTEENSTESYHSRKDQKGVWRKLIGWVKR